MLQNIYFKYFFTIFCLLVLMNGSNFIDGMNSLFLGYYLIITFILICLTKEFQFLINYPELGIIFSIILILFAFNAFGQLLSGDGGVYIISTFIGLLMINIVNLSEKISPYFIACLLWYPAYECLFSMIRKKLKNQITTKPDNRHLHHLIFLFLKEKIEFKTEYINLMTGICINLFNVIVFFIAYQNFSQTKILTLLIFLSLIFYTFIYFYLLKKLKV